MDRATIDAAVDRAFEAFSSLAVTGLLEKESVSGFDFSTGDIDSTASSASIDMLFVEQRYEDKAEIHRYVVKTADFDTDVGYTAIVIGNKRYFIEKASIFEGVTELELRGENSA